MAKELKVTVTVAEAVLLLNQSMKMLFEAHRFDEAMAIGEALDSVFSSAQKGGLAPTDSLMSARFDEEGLRALIAKGGPTTSEDTQTYSFDLKTMSDDDVLAKVSELLKNKEL